MAKTAQGRPSTAPPNQPLTDTADDGWQQFVAAYANGRWSPHKIPHNPTAQDHNTPTLRHALRASFSNNQSQDLPHPPPHLPSSSSSPPSSSLSPERPVHALQATAATLRWAGSFVDISPLALPSPEHELTDPMRGAVAVVPRSHPPDPPSVPPDHVITPGSTRSHRLSSFWQGTIDVQQDSNQHDYFSRPSTPPDALLPTPDISPDTAQTNYLSVSRPQLSGTHSDSSVIPLPRRSPFARQSSSPLPESSPLDPIAVDEFSSPPRLHLQPATTSLTSGSNTLPQPLSLSPVSTTVISPADIAEHSNNTTTDTSQQPGQTRDSSTPRHHPTLTSLPPPHLLHSRSHNPQTPAAVPQSYKSPKPRDEHQLFLELGYLVPPSPPDELDRRRALYKFNIWNTGPDLNFSRIAHLAKLVFNTKGVAISLIDSCEQWFKSHWGFNISSCMRHHSLCAHTILQRGDEPMIVLDTHLDWRFAKNPLVTGPPHIRFYAGAPLRTQDGYNIGTLMVIDESPRDEFSPRQRHTLKEFAAIAMREMELWRDKIQLRIRDRIQSSMEQFSRECLEIDSEAQAQRRDDRPDLIVGASMDKVYSRAAKLVKRTLDVEGVIVMDVSHCEVLESMGTEGSVSVVMHHGEPVGVAEAKSESLNSQESIDNVPPTPTLSTMASNAGGGSSSLSGASGGATVRQLTAEEYSRLVAYFAKHPDGKISEGIVPPAFRPFLPTRIQYALTVPIFNIDKRPFALLCAYNSSEHTMRFLEGHELSYLRAIGVIILSAVLKRRMILADKAKSLFISNISHELRTPLHGILAAAELLEETPLNHSQASCLQTIQACGTSLVETVNHVLDFTKLSGNSKSGGVEKVIVSSRVDLMQLVEEAVDGCWVGYRARTQVMRDSGIGSVYSPPEKEQGQGPPPRRDHVETVVDIGYREGGWILKCEKGGIRRVLMNLFGNSLKFTSDGYVHVVLRQLPSGEDDPPNKIKIELCVIDTGKGISQNFLKNQLFHPFSQENPLQTGTGLGLAIVNSIVHSDSVGGKVDVWSEEGLGTEIKVTFYAEVPDDEEGNSSSPVDGFRFDDPDHPPIIALVGFDSTHRGVQLLYSVLHRYLVMWWGFRVVQSEDSVVGDIVILNNDPSMVVAATERRDTSRPFLIFSASRGSPALMAIASDHERIGGFCRIVYKPGGPSRLRTALKLCFHALKIASNSKSNSPRIDLDADGIRDSARLLGQLGDSPIPRRNSEESHGVYRVHSSRPKFPRSSTAHPGVTTWKTLSSPIETDERQEETISPTISVGNGGTLLKSSVGTINAAVHRFRVLVVEDNSILRSLLAKWLKNKGYYYREAVDGRDGVNVYRADGPFDVVLLDLSMPVLDGIGATSEIRQIEAARAQSELKEIQTRILALTGMSSLEDKRRAFEAGVDGYLVKPVAFKTLDEMFHKLGIS